MRWLRYIGAVLLPLCGWLAGDACRQRSMTHVRELESTIVLLRRIRQEIVFRRTDLEKLFHILWEGGVLNTFSEGASLHALLPPDSFSKEERQCFLECMQGLGRACAEQEAQRLEYYLARFISFREQAERSANAQAGLPHKLGVAAGAVLALVFL